MQRRFGLIDPDLGHAARSDGPCYRTRPPILGQWDTQENLVIRAKGRHELTFSALQKNKIEDPGTFNQITQSKPPRIRQKTVQPFQANFLNPNRRAALFSGEEVDRSTYTSSDPSGLRVVRNATGENLLLRHSYCQKISEACVFTTKSTHFWTSCSDLMNPIGGV
jgi:hypothetical protein